MNARGTCNARHAVLAGCPDPECYRFDEPPFGARVKAEREARGWTQKQLADAVNRLSFKFAQPVAQQHVADYEAGGRQPSLARARAFADALGVSLDELAGREHHRNGDRFPIVKEEMR